MVTFFVDKKRCAFRRVPNACGLPEGAMWVEFEQFGGDERELLSEVGGFLSDFLRTDGDSKGLGRA